MTGSIRPSSTPRTRECKRPGRFWREFKPDKLTGLIKNIPNRQVIIILLFFHRILAEITGTIEKGNFEYEKDLSCEFLAVTKIHIDMGKKKKNPVTAMLFFDKEGKKVEPMTEEELSHLAPGRVDYDKLLILLRLETFLLFCPLFELSFFREQNPSADMEEEARKKIESLISENKDWKVKWHLSTNLSRKD